MEKPIVMLHYCAYGVERSPNTQFDILRNNDMLASRYSFVTLDQPEAPRIHGHLRTIIELTRKIRQIHPHVVHIIGVKEGFHCVLAAWFAGCKKRILVTHGFAGVSQQNCIIRRAVFQWIIEPITLLLSTAVQCNSMYSYNQGIIKKFARNKRYAVYNFSELPKDMLSSDKSWRRIYKIDDDDFLVATIGNMHVGKGYDILTKVINSTAGNSRIKFVVIGDGGLRRSFEDDNRRYIISGKVICTGALLHSDAMQILSQADLFYLPTRFETFGMVFAEAGFCSKPSIGTELGAVREIIEDGETGYLVSLNDHESAQKYIAALSNDKPKCREMGQKANIRVSALFSSTRIAEEIADLYEKNPMCKGGSSKWW